VSEREREGRGREQQVSGRVRGREHNVWVTTSWRRNYEGEGKGERRREDRTIQQPKLE